MATELEELATRASDDPSLSGAELEGLIVSVIQQTRRCWAIMSDQPPEMEPDTSGDGVCEFIRLSARADRG